MTSNWWQRCLFSVQNIQIDVFHTRPHCSVHIDQIASICEFTKSGFLPFKYSSSTHVYFPNLPCLGNKNENRGQILNEDLGKDLGSRSRWAEKPRMWVRRTEMLCSDILKGPEEASASPLALVGQGNVFPPHRSCCCHSHSASDQGCIHLGPAPISPGPSVHHKLVLQILKVKSQHQRNSSWGEHNMEDQT